MIETRGLTKVFRDRKRGEIRAVDGVTLSCQPGEVFGVLGPNGAGKTTLLRMLVTILTPSDGTATVAGHDIRTDPGGVRKNIGFLSNSTALYERVTAREMVSYFAALNGLSGAELRRRVDEVFTQLEMHEFGDSRCDRLSTGQKQRVSIARAIVHQPPVLFFDEPTTGLDLISARTVNRFIRQCAREGRTVVFSTHIMSEVEVLCDRIAVLYRGQIAAVGTLEELRARTGKQAFEHVFLSLIGEDDTDDSGPAPAE